MALRDGVRDRDALGVGDWLLELAGVGERVEVLEAVVVSVKVRVWDTCCVIVPVAVVGGDAELVCETSWVILEEMVILCACDIVPVNVFVTSFVTD